MKSIEEYIFESKVNTAKLKKLGFVSRGGDDFEFIDYNKETKESHGFYRVKIYGSDIFQLIYQGDKSFCKTFRKMNDLIEYFEKTKEQIHTNAK